MSGSVGDFQKTKSEGKPKKVTKVVTKLDAIEQSIKGSKDQIEKPWIKTPQADTFFGVIILLNAGFIGLDIELGIVGFNLPLWICESVFLLIFFVEITLRIWAERPVFRNFFDSWGIFDLSVTVLGIVDAWIVTPLSIMSGSQESPLSSFAVLRMFRLIRLVRLIRVLRMFSELVVLVQTIGNSMRAVAWMSLLLGMIMYTGSIITVLMIGQPHKDDPEVVRHFGTLGNALFAHFMVVTLEGWPDVANAAMEHHWLWAIYFVGVIVLTNFALVNLMVGVIVERIIHLSMEQENELASFVAESKQFKSTLQTLFESADMDHSGEVTRDEIRALLGREETHQIMNAFGININIPEVTLYNIMDIKRDGTTSFEEFYDACMRLCGSKQSVHSIFVQNDICECQREISSKIDKLNQTVANLAETQRLPVAAAPSLEGTRESKLPDRRSVSASVGTGGAEGPLLELLDRMDRFGQVQQSIFAEMHAIRESTQVVGPIIPAPEPAKVANGVAVMENAGKEIGACCDFGVESLFSMALMGVSEGGLGQGSRLRAASAGPSVAASPRIGSADNNNVDVRLAKRRELEAEFREKRGFRVSSR